MRESLGYEEQHWYGRHRLHRVATRLPRPNRRPENRSVAPWKGQLVIFIATRSGIGFPDGMAPTARVRAYAEGLRKAGRDVWVLCMSGSSPVGDSASVRPPAGEYRGIPYRYTTGTPTLAGNRMLRAVQRARGTIGAASLILRRNWRERDVEAIILYPDSLPAAVTLRVVAWACHAPLLLEKSELPAVHRPQTGWSRYTLPVYVAATYRLFDGIIVVSDHLEHYFASRMGRHARLLQVPILVDPAFAEATADVTQDPPYFESRIAYAGGLTEAKDGVLTLIEAFRQVASACAKARLVIIGGSRSDPGFEACAGKARDLGIADRVTLVGQLPRDEVVRCLRSAEVLVLPRPASEQARFGMPTKLAEYLVTGRPVVMTSVGQQATMLRDRETAFIVPPGDVTSLAAALIGVLSDREVAEAVGLSGRSLALREFSAQRHGQRIAEFIGSC
jgi:glycosyltransferase involved in cell wall biosynthesis